MVHSKLLAWPRRFKIALSRRKDRLAIGLIVLFSMFSMALITWAIMSFLSLQALATATNRYAEVWNKIGRTVEYVSTRTEAGTLNEVAISGIQRRLEQLIDEEQVIAKHLKASIEKRNLFWVFIGFTREETDEITKATSNVLLIKRLREVSTASPDTVHSSLSYWPTEMSVMIRTHATNLLATSQKSLDVALPNSLVVFWWLLAIVFAILTFSILLVWKFLIVSTLQSLHDTERSLRAQRRDLRLVLDNVPALICWVGSDMKMQTVNETFRSRFGHFADLRGQHIGAVLGDENWPYIKPHLSAALRGERVNVDVDLTLDGACKAFQFNLVPEMCEAGDFVARVYVMIVDIQKRVEVERILRHSQENLSSTLNSIGDALIAIDEEARVTQFNQVAEKLTGLHRDDAQGMPLSDVVSFWDPKTKKPHVFNTFCNDVEAASLTRLDAHLDLELVPASGENISIACSVAPILSHQGKPKGAVIVFRDISLEQRLREQAHHNEKMNAIGQLAGGVAHDFNNMLGGILVQLEMLKMQHADTSLKESILGIDSMLRTVDRARELTRKLTAFARVEALGFRALNIPLLISDTLELIRETADRRILFDWQPPSEGIYVRGNASALQAVILNILLNGIQAMRNGGRLTVALRNEILDAPLELSRAFTIAEGSYVVLIISDTGTGMSEEAVEHIFDPFFTTKKAYGGTGLGLAAAYGTLTDHKGGARVTTKIGSGTSFEIYLPANAQDSTERAPAKRQRLHAQAHKQTILLVDDEDALRTTSGLYLQKKGYSVLTAEDGQIALDIFKENAEIIDLCLLDVNLPKLNGYQVYRRIQKIRPGTRVVFVTGFSSEPELNNLVKRGMPILQKPYRLRELDTIISEVLAGRPTSSDLVVQS